MKKIVLSLSMIGAVAVLAIGATGAFFSDSETSTGNTFAAGAIDLQVDNESYYNAQPSPNTSWELTDLTVEKFFNFNDVKPGDDGEDTISLHINNNDSWLCADVKLTSNNDNGLTEPEAEDGDLTPGPLGEGELASHINFIWWADDGDNVLEDNETVLPGGPLGALAVGETASVALADASANIWGDNGPIPANSNVRYIAKAWCFGDIASAALAQSEYAGPANDNNDDTKVDERDGGFTCSGAAQANNVTQTDSMTADISFYAVQSRNNPDFLCSQRVVPPGPNDVTQ